MTQSEEQFGGDDKQKKQVTVYPFTPNRVGESICIAVGRADRGGAAFTNWTYPEATALVMRLWIAVGVNLYVIAFIFPCLCCAQPPVVIPTTDNNINKNL